MRGIHRGRVNSPHKLPVTRKMFPLDDVIMSIALEFRVGLSNYTHINGMWLLCKIGPQCQPRFYIVAWNLKATKSSMSTDWAMLCRINDGFLLDNVVYSKLVATWLFVKYMYTVKYSASFFNRTAAEKTCVLNGMLYKFVSVISAGR